MKKRKVGIGLFDMPQEMFWEICRFLSGEFLLTMRLICKTWELHVFQKIVSCKEYREKIEIVHKLGKFKRDISFMGKIESEVQTNLIKTKFHSGDLCCVTREILRDIRKSYPMVSRCLDGNEGLDESGLVKNPICELYNKFKKAVKITKIEKCLDHSCINMDVTVNGKSVNILHTCAESSVSDGYVPLLDRSLYYISVKIRIEGVLEWDIGFKQDSGNIPNQVRNVARKLFDIGSKFGVGSLQFYQFEEMIPDIGTGREKVSVLSLSEDIDDVMLYFFLLSIMYHVD